MNSSSRDHEHTASIALDESELEHARVWISRLLDGVVNANSAAEAVLISAYRSHGQ